MFTFLCPLHNSLKADWTANTSFTWDLSQQQKSPGNFKFFPPFETCEIWNESN